jgi:hypothetical protein
MSARIQELTAEYESQVEVLKAQREAVRIALKDRMLELGVKSVNTASGTVILSVKQRYITQDWDSFRRFIVEHDAVDLLEQRISQTNMATFLKENPDAVPPGLNSSSEYSVIVRRPK